MGCLREHEPEDKRPTRAVGIQKVCSWGHCSVGDTMNGNCELIMCLVLRIDRSISFLLVFDYGASEDGSIPEANTPHRCRASPSLKSRGWTHPLYMASFVIFNSWCGNTRVTWARLRVSHSNATSIPSYPSVKRMMR